jgi:hypothetical protein
MLAVALATSVTAVAQPLAYVCIPNTTLTYPDGPNTTESKLETEHCTYGSTHSLDAAAWARSRTQLVVLFWDKTANAAVTLDSVQLLEVALIVRGQRYVVQTLPAWDMKWKYFAFTMAQINGIPLDALEHGELVTVDIKTKSSNVIPIYLNYGRPRQPYGLLGSKSYVWFPVGLFSIDFRHHSDGGIPLSALPIGIAGGIKFNFGDGFYLGTSLMLNYLITPKVADSTGKNSGDYSFQAMTVGALLDISNYAYVGVALGHDWRTHVEQPGVMIIAGVAPGALDVLKSKPQ